jgi:hypothetical protein
VHILTGMLLGKVGPTQLMLCAIMCVTSYGINYWICIYMLGGWDHTGGSCVIHIFGAFFGMGCTLLASQKGSAQNPDNAPRYVAMYTCTSMCVCVCDYVSCMGCTLRASQKGSAQSLDNVAKGACMCACMCAYAAYSVMAYEHPDKALAHVCAYVCVHVYVM